MRLARVLDLDLTAGVMDAPSTPRPILALERDGALYSVSALEKWYVTAYSPDTFATSSDFRSRVIALGGAGLAELDDRLGSGLRPVEARLVDGSFFWLPPVDEDHASLVEVDVFHAKTGDGPATPGVTVASGRSLIGHRTGASLDPRTTAPRCSAAVGIVLHEDLASATAPEAERAIFGATPLLRWHGTEGGVTELAAHIGPVLLHPVRYQGGRFDPSEALGTLNIGETSTRLTALSSASIDVAEAVALASHRLPLRAGDIVALGPLPAHADGRRLFDVALGETVSFQVEGLGTLEGRAVATTRPERWRR